MPQGAADLQFLGLKSQITPTEPFTGSLHLLGAADLWPGSHCNWLPLAPFAAHGNGLYSFWVPFWLLLHGPHSAGSSVPVFASVN